MREYLASVVPVASVGNIAHVILSCMWRCFVKLEINGETYQVPREYELKIFDQLWNKEALPWYEKLNKAWKVGAMLFSRGILLFMEEQIYKETGDREKAKAVRPKDKHDDPNLHLGELLAKILFEGLNYVTIACETGVDATSGEKFIASFNVQIEGAPRSEASLALSQDQSKAG